MNESSTDLLLSRIVDGEAGEHEWAEFESAANARPQLWKELAQLQRDSAAMVSAVSKAGEVAGRIDLARLAAGRSAPRAGGHLVLNRLGAWTGWAVAAAVGIVATIQVNQHAALNGPSLPHADPTQQTGIIPSFDSAADAFNAYLAKGKESGEVIGEMPTKVLVDSRQNPAGKGYEVVYIRQVVERTIVPDLYQVQGKNELGQPTLARYAQPVRRSM